MLPFAAMSTTSEVPAEFRHAAARPGALTLLREALEDIFSRRRLVGYLVRADIKKKGVATIACLSVNDAFVMHAWGKAQNTEGKVDMLADGNGEYTKALGLELDATGFGMGMRGQRFSLVIDNGVVKQVNVEQKGEFKVSSAEHALTQL